MNIEGSRKFVVAIVSLILSFIFMVLSTKFNLNEIALPFFSGIGAVSSGFFAANTGEHWLNRKKGDA